MAQTAEKVKQLSLDETLELAGKVTDWYEECPDHLVSVFKGINIGMGPDESWFPRETVGDNLTISASVRKGELGPEHAIADYEISKNIDPKIYARAIELYKRALNAAKANPIRNINSESGAIAYARSLLGR